MLRDIVLAAIAANPGVSRHKMDKLCPDAKRNDISVALRDLHAEGLIEITGHCYRLVAQEPAAPAPAPAAPRYMASGFIAPIARARLMSGR